MNSKLNYFVFIGAFLLLFSGCEKEKPQPQAVSKKGLMVLNEGLFQLNNSSITWIDKETGTINTNFFEEQTGRQLGDTGNDLLRYGNKIYILVNVSSTLEILDASTFQSIRQISITENGNSAEPRFMTALNGEIYFSTFAGKVWCLDTTQLSITHKITVGLNPDQITNDGRYLYVSNSGGLNPSIYDSTVSVINPITKTEIKKITVGKNPGNILFAGDKNIYVITRGNYSDIQPQLHRINPQTLEQDTVYSIQATHLVDYSSTDMLLGVQTPNNEIGIYKFNFATEKVKNTPFLTNLQLGILHNIQFSKQSKKIYLMDADNYTNTGKLWVYDKTGNYLNNYKVGLNPTKVIEFE